MTEEKDQSQNIQANNNNLAITKQPLGDSEHPKGCH